MNEETRNAMLVFADKIRSQEDELNKLKRVVNGLCADEGQSPMFPNVASESGGSIHSLRIDQFYGQTLAGAARQYLEMRKASGLGAATVNEIYSALKAGGYNFETENEANAKNGVRISLRKNSAIFHRLPNDGGYGLANWYGIKAANEGSDSRGSRKKGLKRKGKARDIKKQVETASIG